MMKAKYLLAIVLLPLIAGVAFAQLDSSAVGGSGAMLFEAGGSARSLAMGQANTGLADQGEAVLYNPAGLAEIHSAQLALMGGSLYGGCAQSVLSFNMPWATFGTFGLTYTGAFGAIEDPVGPDGQPISDQSMNNSGVLISYAKKFGFLGVGVAPKLMFSQLADEQALGFDVDAGFSFYPMSFVPSLSYDMITLGVAVKNILGATMDFTGSGMEPANPRIIRAGLGLRLLDDRVKLGSDISYTLGDNSKFGWYEGLEVYPAKPLAIRLGVNDRFFSAGLGIITELSRNLGLEINYAFMMNHASEFNLDPIHKVSLNLDLKSVAGVWVESKPAQLNSPADYAEIVVHGNSQFKNRTKRWIFEIKDAGGNVRYRQTRDVYGEIDELPAKFTWNGVDNIRGGQVDNGTYYYSIKLFDKLGDQIVYDGQLVKVDWKGVRR
ncbi:hypothetical protein GX441_01235 [bacterium]|nr:hypothetical protein [bacterium]